MPVWQNNHTVLNMVKKVNDCLLLSPWYLIWMSLQWARYRMFSFVVYFLLFLIKTQKNYNFWAVLLSGELRQYELEREEENEKITFSLQACTVIKQP